MIDINDYKQIYNRKIKSTTKIWILVIVFIIIGIIYINSSFKYIKYYSNLGEYKDSYINMYVLLEDIDKITKNKKIKIKEEEFAYKIKSISEENIYMNNNYYKKVKIELKECDFIENEVLNINIQVEEEKIIKYIFETVWR